MHSGRVKQQYSHSGRLELLSFIATFYWARTAETFDNAGKTFQPAELRTVVANLTSRLQSTINAKYAVPMYREDNFIAQSHIMSTADDESILYMIYERRLLLGYQHIIDTLAHTLYNDQNFQGISSLYDELSICIEIFLRYTARSVCHVRELQSLKWMVEAIMQEDSLERRSGFLRIGRAFASVLESRLGNMISSFAANRLELLTTWWGHPWFRK